MRTGRGQRVAAAWAVRGQPCPAVGTELPMRGDLAAAIVALLDKLVKRLLELQEGGLLPALLRLSLVLLFVHGVPSVSHWTSADSSLRSRGIEQDIHLCSDRERVLCPPLCTRLPCGSVRTAHGPRERTPRSERPMPCITRRRLDDWDEQRSTRPPSDQVYLQKLPVYHG